MRAAVSIAVVLLAAACASTPVIPAEWMTVPEAARVGNVSLDADGKIGPPAIDLATGAIHVEGNRIHNGEKALTPALEAIDSFDFSPSRGEVAFSAKRDGDFDIGLVSSDGSPISWIPDDPADEVGVQWAPRGNKISYIVRVKGGDVVRTLHIPTSFQLSNVFPGATIRALAWDPPAERYAVVYSTPDASERVEVMKYDGKERRIIMESDARLDVEVEPFAPDAIVLRPRDVRYEERLPVVVWVAEDFGWSDARAALMNDARVALIVTTRTPDAALWQVISETTWMDPSHAFVVWAPGGTPVAGVRDARPPTVIVGDPALAGNRYRRQGNVVRVAPRVVQSFAARFIADQLKRVTPPNATSR